MKKLLFTTALLLTTIHSILAQPSMPSDPSQAPIDGGLLWLLLGGGAYGIKKLRDRQKDSEV